MEDKQHLKFWGGKKRFLINVCLCVVAERAPASPLDQSLSVLEELESRPTACLRSFQFTKPDGGLKITLERGVERYWTKEREYSWQQREGRFKNLKPERGCFLACVYYCLLVRESSSCYRPGSHCFYTQAAYTWSMCAVYTAAGIELRVALQGLSSLHRACCVVGNININMFPRKPPQSLCTADVWVNCYPKTTAFLSEDMWLDST